jgi:hypothetical protein
MEIRDSAANRSFSGNGLWQWYEKQGLERHECVVSRIRSAPLSFLGLRAVVSFGNAQVSSVAKREMLDVRIHRRESC